MSKDKKQPKYIFVTGGVLSGVGKGITAASIGNILKARGFKVNIQKCDPYLNVDAGTLNPGEHGECFVTADGAETDLDLGHYERFMDVELKRSSSLISGRLLSQVIADERAGKYLGKTVQIIPHVTNAIVENIEKTAEGFDVHIVEIGGTVGDYEGLSFIEAIRELGVKVGPENATYVHVVYLPYLGASKELKTKPAQNAVRELRGLGIVPNVLVARSEHEADEDIISKLSMFSGVKSDAVIMLPNARTIYEVPLTLEDAGIGDVLTDSLSLPRSKADLSEWKKLVDKAVDKNLQKVDIAIVAKYLNNEDTYMSVFEALTAAAWSQDVRAELHWVDAEKITKANVANKLSSYDAIVVPGGFGSRGVEGMILSAEYALEHKKPYYGICLGLQVAVVAAARRAGLKNAHTTEINPSTTHPVISTMSDQVGKESTGGTMRLGNYDEHIVSNTKTADVYGVKTVLERHRHRYECNNDYRDDYESWGIIVSATSPDKSLVEMIEARDHPYFLAAQSHPEFNSRPNRPHAPFVGLIHAVKSQK